MPALPSRGRKRLYGAAVLGLFFGLAASGGPAEADKVGVAAAVNPDAFSSLSGAPQGQLKIGKSIFYNERINTTASGLVQVLLVDGSTFTVGPGSDLVIDKFVYDPRKKTGKIVATFSKGTMRFIGGKISKNEGGVTVKTPDGALAIRGGMFQGSTLHRIYAFMYGDTLTLTRNGQSITLWQPGNTFQISGSGVTRRPTTPEDTNVFMQALTNGNAGNLASGTDIGTGGPGQNQAFQQGNNQSDTATELTSDANIIQVQTAILEQLLNLEMLKNPPPTDNTPNTTTTTTTTTTPTTPTTDPVGPEPEPPVKDGGTFTGYASGFLQTGVNGNEKPLFLTFGRSEVTLDPDADIVTANIKVTFWPTATRFNLGFRGEGELAYIDDDTFLALGDDGSSSVIQRGWKWKPFEYGEVSHEGVLASVPASLCDNCKSFRYGFWASDVSYGEYTDKMGGWWIGSNAPVSAKDMPITGTARYEGLAVGTLAERSGNSDIWQQKVGATGNMSMDWYFADRAGWLQIDDFGTNPANRKSFGGPMFAPGRVHFIGPIAGSGGIGAASGSFVGPRPGQAPTNIMGNFGIAAPDWRANGIFGGGVVPNQIAIGNY